MKITRIANVNHRRRTVAADKRKNQPKRFKKLFFNQNNRHRRGVHPDPDNPCIYRVYGNNRPAGLSGNKLDTAGAFGILAWAEIGGKNGNRQNL